MLKYLAGAAFILLIEFSFELDWKKGKLNIHFGLKK